MYNKLETICMYKYLLFFKSSSQKRSEKSPSLVWQLFILCSLGAIHDGQQNKCNGTVGYVMAPSSGARVGVTAINPWMFSSCSVEEIETVIDKLNT